MTNAGFRPYPGDEIYRQWESMGGRWVVKLKAQDDPLVVVPGLDVKPQIKEGRPLQFRPVHPDHGWNHYPWMWRMLTGEDMTPTAPGWYWLVERGTTWEPWLVMWMGENKDVLATSEGVPVGHYGQWGGPVVGMPGEVGK